MTTSRVSQLVKAPREAVYRAFVDPDLLVRWLAPHGMTAQVLSFDAREGGGYRMSLTYDAPGGHPAGKTSEDTDTFESRFVQLRPGRRIAQAVRFQSDDPAMAGVMTMRATFADAPGGTEVTLEFEDLPPGVRPEDNDEGSRQSLAKLAALFEG